MSKWIPGLVLNTVMAGYFLATGSLVLTVALASFAFFALVAMSREALS